MVRFNNIPDLQNYCYTLFAQLTNSRMFLSAKMIKAIESSIYDFYNNQLGLICYNDKFQLRLAKRGLYLERKMMRKNFRENRKYLYADLKISMSNVKPFVETLLVPLSSGKLPPISNKGKTAGLIVWDENTLKIGVNDYSWSFIPSDMEKFNIQHGKLALYVYDDKKETNVKVLNSSSENEPEEEKSAEA